MRLDTALSYGHSPLVYFDAPPADEADRRRCQTRRQSVQGMSHLEMVQRGARIRDGAAAEPSPAPATAARYSSTFFVVSVLPAPLSPEMSTDCEAHDSTSCAYVASTSA